MISQNYFFSPVEKNDPHFKNNIVPLKNFWTQPLESNKNRKEGLPLSVGGTNGNAPSRWVAPRQLRNVIGQLKRKIKHETLALYYHCLKTILYFVIYIESKQQHFRKVYLYPSAFVFFATIKDVFDSVTKLLKLRNNQFSFECFLQNQQVLCDTPNKTKINN